MHHFPIVGVGASAGGLEAFTLLLKHLPVDTGLGFVLVQHLDPQHASALPHLLGKTTSMPVREITHNLRVAPNRVYVIPPGQELSIVGGVLKLRPRGKRSFSPGAIDSFFATLAADQHEWAIGVILSGTAADGSLGLEAIKAEGGITFAQDHSAHYDSMPRHAVGTGCVDFILSPENIAGELARIARHPYVAGQSPALPKTDGPVAAGQRDKDTPVPAGAKKAARRDERPAPQAAAGGNGFKRILDQLHNHSGVDFSLYKPSTIQRRITRRIVLNKQNSLEEYSGFLRGNGKEIEALYSDVLISVTGFFRNAGAFNVLKRKVFPQLRAQRGDDPLRVWVMGCSTGQEAYSVAMAFVESGDNARRSRRLQVFATDLNETLLDKARHGLYPKTLAQDVSPERVRRFFVEEEAGYRITKSLRQMVIFARQNLISDPPFSHMDLISCRNVLIYLEPNVQDRAIGTFHYALKPGGFLFLGASESIGGFTRLFEAADKKHKIFLKKESNPVFPPLPHRKGQPPALPGARARLGPAPKAGRIPEPPRAEPGAEREADRIVLNRFSPPGVLIDADLQILQFRGPTSLYLQPPPSGKANFDLLKMAREGLLLPLRGAIKQARKEKKGVRRENIRVDHNGRPVLVNVEVIPLKNLREECWLVLFEDAEKAGRIAAPSASTPAIGKKEATRRVARLESELSEMRDYLRSVQEQNEAATEELQGANEEVQSANEELQSINEELETSKEELESANEELITVNEEMAARNIELNLLNGDLVNFQASTKLPLLLLGRDLIIRRFSAPAERILDLSAADLGRPLSGIRHHLTSPDEAADAPAENEAAESPVFPLEDLAREVIDSVREQEREVRDRNGRWYSLRVRPYLTLDNQVDGAVIVLLDISELKVTEQQLRGARDYAEAVIRTARDPILILRADLSVNTANEAFYKTFKTTPEQTEGRPIFELGDGAWNIPKLRQLLEDILPRNSFFNDFDVTHDFPHLGERTMLLNARRLSLEDGSPPMILLATEDVSERQQADVSMASLAAIVSSSDDAIVGKDLNGIITSWNKSAQRLFGYTAEEAIGQSIVMLIPLERRVEEPVILARIRRGERIEHFETIRIRKDGSSVEISLTISPIRNTAGAIIGASKVARDITERKRAEKALRESEQRYRTLFDLGPVAVYSCDASGVIEKFNRRAAQLWGREPALGDTDEQFCGSAKLFRPDGSFLPHAECPMAEVLAGRILEARNAEVVIERPDGTRITVVVNIHALKDERGRITGAINCFYDITERKRVEEALRLAQIQLANRAGQLEQAVNERTAELTAANRQLEAFVYSIAHDLRAPLRAMQGFSAALVAEAGSAVTEKGQAYARKVDKSAQFMDALLQDMLAFSRLAQQNIEWAPVNLAPVVESVLARLQTDILERNARVENCGPWPVVLAHEPVVAQVLFNLVANALKFVAPDTPPLVRLRSEDRAAHVRVWVEDNGIGVSPDYQEQIFRLFTRLNGEKYPGTGLGLAIVQKGAERLGGNAGVESVPGEGSRFWFELRKA